jgi:hypothetical protein
MSFFKVGLEDEEDEGLRKLDAKVEKTLREIAQTSADAPESMNQLLQALAKLMKQKNVTLDREAIAKLVQQAYNELPKIAGILGHWTDTLSAYANYRALTRQEKLSQQILKSNQLLARSTVVLAIATFALVAATVWFHL